ncbi:hypothetical protein N7495_007159 [Penicillium taxi]|uniref:uncharacterized protein n=1 Tax=Penicillium taxi TaxID=168475 RepID=UPI0025457053|nr:uncharacterized protein N7495_007159 [Penicillium taxi]KAJ5895468.1 hypothetical protein N7495_007159 [Penicillium taxi]
MTGPRRSPTSPWVQTAQGYSHDVKTTQPYHPIPSSTAAMHHNMLSGSSPNYFGLSVDNTSNPPSSNPGPHAQKNWGAFSKAQSTLPSPKLQLYPEASVSEGLASLLRTESQSDKSRHESALQDHRDRVTSWAQGASSGRGLASQKTPMAASLESAYDSSHWTTPERCAEFIKSSLRNVLLLDVRPYAHFSQANIKGSLNLCIPTTLLKRRSFDTQKLEATFTNDGDKQKFARWKDCSTIIVYDSATSEVKDAAPLFNVINKFQAEGWTGEGLILRGGFKNFSIQFAGLIYRPHAEKTDPTPKKRSPMSISLPSVAPVVGGCALPESSSAMNPFFSNIRQNMDLVGGVGQVPLKLPDGLTEDKRRKLPTWLRDASDSKDQGRLVSNKFLDLEKRELERMRQALSYEASSGSTGGASKKYRVAGIEKGTKNRYNDIYPFDHTRVRLEGIPLGGCDYVNANHIKAEFSNRRYIATQAPVPDTFNDFWRVVWEQDVRVIITLTAELERGQVKCHPYWQPGDYGPLKVKSYTEKRIFVETKDQRPKSSQPHSVPGEQTQCPDETNENPVIIVRHFSLYHSHFPFLPIRDITQLQYPYWPDFGTTSQPTHLLNLIEQCNKVVRSTSNPSYGSHEPEPTGQRPILVHCSAGCGRTGTFCTVDSVLDILKRQRAQGAHSVESPQWTRDSNLDLITKTVEDFRTQRPSMVQNLSQFVLCYESVLEWLVSRANEDNT